MPHADFRSFLQTADEAGLVRTIRRQVDPLEEPGCYVKLMFHGLPESERFGFRFTDVSGSALPLATAVLGASTRAYALALGIAPGEINNHWLRALQAPLPTRLIQSGQCQENVLTGEDARLDRLPIPVWTPGKDPAPYITTLTVLRNAETGIQNVAVYRTQVTDAGHVVVNINPGRQGYDCMQSSFARGEPAPVAWVIGAEPECYAAAVANLRPGFDELTVAGAMRGEAINMVQAKTSALQVPASAELVIEGEILPDAAAAEGPFGESAGYMSGGAPKPVARITAITQRNNACYYGLASQMPPSESTVLQSLSNAGVILHMLRHEAGEDRVVDAHIDLMFGGGAAHIIIAMDPVDREHVRRVGRLIADHTPVKRITIVDADIDIRDRLELDWVMSSHYNPDRDTDIISGYPTPMDHAVLPDAAGRRIGSKVVIDATRSSPMGPGSLPPRKLMEQALQSWGQDGLPDVHIRGRLQRRLERG